MIKKLDARLEAVYQLDIKAIDDHIPPSDDTTTVRVFCHKLYEKIYISKMKNDYHVSHVEKIT